MSLRMMPGLASMLKEGTKHFKGMDEAVIRCIEACVELSQSLTSCFGPNGLNKIVINHIEKLFVTNDAATILGQLEVQHPAAKLLVMASQMQESEVGDNTNLVMMFAGALLENAEAVLKMGLKPVEIVEGYELALEKALEILPSLAIDEVKNFKNEAEVKKVIRSAVMSKQLGYEDFLADLITKACVGVLPEETTFNVDNVRVCKILGGNIFQSQVVHGMVFKRQVEGDVTNVKGARVAVFTCPLDALHTETKGTVLIKTAQELKDFSAGEESMLEEQIKAIKDSGANVIVTGGKVGDLALHYVNKYGLMVVRVPSKFDVRRVTKSCGATALPKLVPPTVEDLGMCDSVYIDELGDTPIVVFKQGASKISTIVLRAASDNTLDDLERAIDDGVNTYKALTRDGRLLAGAGASEMELAKQIRAYGATLPGLEQYAVQKFAEALEVVPKTLIDTSGLDQMQTLAALRAAHHDGKVNMGVDIDATKTEAHHLIDAKEAAILDTYLGKMWALKYAVGAACTVLRVDQIIMSKPAGGPKPKQNNEWDDD